MGDIFKCLGCEVVTATMSADEVSEYSKAGPGAVDPTRVLEFVISTKDIDRDGDTIDPKGWVLDEFNRTGVVLWQHGQDNNVGMLPIARPLKTWTAGGVLRSRAEFAPPVVNPMGEQVLQAFKGGFLRGVSVRFRPIEFGPRKDADGFGTAYTRQELLEYSPVAIAANPQASLADDGKALAELGIIKAASTGYEKALADLRAELARVTKTIDTMRADCDRESAATLQATITARIDAAVRDALRR